MPTQDKASVSQLADDILSRILAGEFQPGEHLRQEALAELFDVSRTPVREALRQLEARGVVVQRPGFGATVRDVGSRDVREAYQIRAELEGLAIELAVDWLTDEQLDRMRKAQVSFAQVVRRLKDHRKPARSKKFGAATETTWVDANDDFHAEILAASGNRRLQETVQNLHLGFVRRVMAAATQMDGNRMRENVLQHDAILDAIERRDPTEARRLMHHHILRSGELLVEWLERYRRT